MLNRYLERLDQLIDAYRAAELVQFEGPGKKKAEFDDLVWYHIDPNTGRRTRFLCCQHGAKMGKGDAIEPSATLRPPYNHLLKVWLIDVSNRPYSAQHKQDVVAAARYALTRMEGNLFAQTEASVNGYLKHVKNRPFFEFCIAKRLMPHIPLYGWREGDRDRTGHTIFSKRLEKLPTEEAVLALGTIFARVFEHVNPDGSVAPGRVVSLIDALTMTFTCLCLASPNRAAAEVLLLPKQKLRSYSENNGPPVYYLEWKGSKGYGDNKTHILAALAEPVEKALNFFHRASESARVICRFYENPNQSLKTLLGTFPATPERLKHLSLTKQPNLFQLGYALGFYGTNDRIRVLKKGADPESVSHSRRASCFEEKPIHSLRSEDQISTTHSRRASYSSLEFLFNVSFQMNPFGNDLVISIGRLQGWWISHFRRVLLPEFPMSRSTGEGRVRLSGAMFASLGSVLKHGGRQCQKSHYSVLPLETLAKALAQRLKGTPPTPNIFEDYDFPTEMRVLPHSLRHYANTLADMSGIPLEIITAWSGRVNPEQTHTYIHTSTEEKADRVQAIINPPSEDNRPLRVVSKTQLSQATNLPASVTSTGLCTQDLNVAPCNYLNDFVAQCFMCPESCHVAGDEESIAFLEKDLSFQTARLEAVSNDSRLPNSEAMKQWYVIHSRNTAILSMLVELMKEQPKGMIIRYSAAKAEFNLTDLNTKSVASVSCSLPDPAERLKRLLTNQEASNPSSSNSDLQCLLSSFGLITEAP